MKHIYTNSYVLHNEEGVSLESFFSIPKTAQAGGLHHAKKSFYDCYSKLPKEVQKMADQAYKKMLVDPKLVNLKRLPGAGNGNADMYAAQIGGRYRALAYKENGAYWWYWIGSHEVYNHYKHKPAPIYTTPTVKVQPVPKKIAMS